MDEIFDRCGYYIFENSRELPRGKSAPPCEGILDFILKIRDMISKDRSIQNQLHMMNLIDEFVEGKDKL